MTTGRLENLDPSLFEVRVKSGARVTPDCATLTPAVDASEGHTILLIGELGSAEDPPVEASVVGSLPLEGGADAKGLSVEVSMYTVETESGDRVPTALGDLGDNDNYEHLCLSEATPALRVRAVAGVVLDPRGDANVETSVEVAR